MSVARLARDRAALVVVDVQEAFRAAVDGFEGVAERTAVLVQGARRLGLPLVVTEQYPRGLGATVDEVAEHLDGIPRLEKVCFAATEADGFDLHGRAQAIVCGIEAHVCVAQTVHALIAQGVEVHVPRDAVASRHPEDRRAALDRMDAAGAVATTTEMALFELLGRAGTPEFSDVQRLVK